jgi:hypothetical protein
VETPFYPVGYQLQSICKTLNEDLSPQLREEGDGERFRAGFSGGFPRANFEGRLKRGAAVIIWSCSGFSSYTAGVRVIKQVDKGWGFDKLDL